MSIIFWCAFWAWLISQLIKMPIYYFRKGEWDWRIALGTGNLPSSHTAVVTATTIAIGSIEGIDSAIFALSFVLAIIVIHDAIMVRGQSGKQARVINQIVKDVDVLQSVIEKKSTRDTNVQLREMLGHTYTEVISGIFVGIVVANIVLISGN